MKQPTLDNLRVAPSIDRKADSFLDHKIHTLLGGFALGHLDPEYRDKFMNIDDLGEQVDQACWRLAAGAERPTAVNLRALYTLRHMDVATQQKVVKPWAFNLPVCDPFWANVDQAMNAYIKKFGDESPAPSTLPHSDNTTVVGSINGYPILREVMQHEGQPPYNVAYSIECQEAIIDLSA